MANYWDGMEGGKHNSDNCEVSFTHKKKVKQPKKTKIKKGKIYRSLIQVEILSNEEVKLDNYSLSDIEEEISNGDWSGKTTKPIVNFQITGLDAVRVIQDQGSDPEFFGMNEKGNELED